MNTGYRAVGANADEFVAIVTVALLGCGTVLALFLLASGRSVGAAAVAAAALVALVVLFAADWLPPLLVLAISLPLPATLSTVGGRLAPAAIITAAVLLSWFINRTLSGRRIEVGAVPVVPCIAILSAVTFSALFTTYPVLAARELFSWILLLGLLVAATDLLIESPSRLRTLLQLQAAVAAVTGVFALSQTLGLLPAAFPLERTNFYRASLGFGQPNNLAMFFAISLPLSVHVAKEATSLSGRILARAGVAACALGLIATFSRGAWLAFVGSTLVLILVGERKLALRITLYGVLGLAAVNAAAGGAIVDRIERTAQDGMVLQRLASTYAGLLMVRENPIVGVGPGGFGEALERVGPQVALLSEYVGSPHNGYVQMAAETGVLGLSALLFFVVAAGRVLWTGFRLTDSDPNAPAHERRLRRTLLWSFGVFCLLGFVEWPLTHGVGQLVILVLAAGVSLERPLRQRFEGP